MARLFNLARASEMSRLFFSSMRRYHYIELTIAALRRELLEKGLRLGERKYDDS